VNKDVQKSDILLAVFAPGSAETKVE